MQPCIDNTELEDMPKVFKKLIGELGFKSRNFAYRKDDNNDNSKN